MAKDSAKKSKRKRIFKVAKELNLSHVTLTEFLQKKGYSVSGPNDNLTEEMYEQVMARFSAEKLEAEKLRARKKEHEEVEMVAETPAEEVISEETASEQEPEKVEASREAEESKDDEHKIDLPVPGLEVGESVKDEPEVQPVEEKIEEEKPVETQKPEPKEEPKEKPKTEQTPPVELKEESPVQDVTVVQKKITHEPPRKKEKKDGKSAEILSAKEKKRRKALELIKKEGKKYKHKVIDNAIDDTEESTVAAAKVAKIGRPKKRKKKRAEVNQQEVTDALKKTLAGLGSTGKKKKKKKIIKEDGVETEVNVLSATEFMSVQELAKALEVDVSEVIKTCMSLGMLVTINQRLEMETIKVIADEFGFEVEEADVELELMEEIEEQMEDNEADLKPRSPVVTVMGHVDHGKTSLLDYIREANVVGGESGGITQHIGAYEVNIPDRGSITFLDTPGHEAFTAMRARGAQVTDIVVLVVAADDRVMPQTEEAIDHSMAAGVSIVVAINKVDKPNANPEKIKKELANRNILVEDWGGKYQCVEVSAKTGQNVDDLLEKILLEAEMLELKANPARHALGTVIESRLDKGKGAVATVLVQNGTLHVGDFFVAGANWGKVRALLDEREMRIEQAGPSTPVQVLGFDGVPEAGDRFVVMETEHKAKEIANKRQLIRREQELRVVRKISLDEFSRQVQAGELKELNILIKSDVAGSAQALADSVVKLSNEEVRVNIVRSAVGPITESDVLLAAASNAILIGFHVRANMAAKVRAEKENVEIRSYKIIYDLVDDIKKAMEGMLAPIEREVVLGTIEVRDTFKISKVGTVAGCYVTSGKVKRNNRVRLIRNDVEIYDGELASLKRFKDDVKEVASGFECGLMIKNYNDIKEGDIVEVYETVEEKKTLDDVKKS